MTKVSAGNLLAGLGESRAEEEFQSLFEKPGVRVERIVSWGQASPEGFWYEQDWDEWVLVLQGQATVRCEDEGLRKLGPGDWISLPAGCRHRVEWTDPTGATIWLAIHLGLEASQQGLEATPGPVPEKNSKKLL
jgi:cupin 2 domain-containing protein